MMKFVLAATALAALPLAAPAECRPVTARLPYAPAMSTDFDAVVVGAGAVGLACGYALARDGKTVAVVEVERRVGAGVSSRNSEVIHAGLHYAPGSLKARLCVQGRRLLYAFLERHRVAFNKCGKLIVATQDSELPALLALAARGEANQVEGITRLDGSRTLAMEPSLRAVAALHSAESGVFDAHGYMDALVGVASMVILGVLNGVIGIVFATRLLRINGSLNGYKKPLAYVYLAGSICFLLVVPSLIGIVLLCAWSVLLGLTFFKGEDLEELEVV